VIDSTLKSIKFEDGDEGRSNEWCFFGKKGDGVRALVIYPDLSVIGRRRNSYELTDKTAIFNVAVMLDLLHFSQL